MLGVKHMNAVLNWDWSGIIQSIASVVVALVAFLALATWKQQLKAQKQTNLLDELTDTVHEYLQLMVQPTEVLKIMRIGIENHVVLPTNRDNIKNPEVVAYIESRGENDSKKLWEYIRECNSSVAKIQSLVAKGQVYGLLNYDVCKSTCKMLLWQHERLQVVAIVIGSTTMNWDHPDVQKSIDSMLTVNPEDIKVQMAEQYNKYIKFVAENYRAIYAKFSSRKG